VTRAVTLRLRVRKIVIDFATGVRAASHGPRLTRQYLLGAGDGLLTLALATALTVATLRQEFAAQCAGFHKRRTGSLDKPGAG
jgi:hypothetical protein